MADLSHGLGGKSPYIPHGDKSDPLRESQESTDSDDSMHNTLLIDTMAFEMAQEKVRPPIEIPADSSMNLPKKILF